MEKTKVKKYIKRTLITLLVLISVSFASLIYLLWQTELFGSPTPLEGEIVPLKNEIRAGEMIPLVLVIPEDLDDLHKEMWDCYFVDKEGAEVIALESLIEHQDFGKHFTDSQLDSMFKDSPTDIRRKDKAIISDYSPRTTIFIPEKSGTYRIYVSGYYRTTSPRGVTSLEVVVYE